MWAGIGALQLMFSGIYVLIIFVALIDGTAGTTIWSYMFAMIMYIVLGINNIIVGIKDIKTAIKRQSNYIGIVDGFSLRTTNWLPYIWNTVVLIMFIVSMNPIGFIMCFLMLIAMAIDFFGIRLYVSRNESGFLTLESIQKGYYPSV